MKKGKRFKKKPKTSRYQKVSLFQKPDVKYFKACPLSGKDALDMVTAFAVEQGLTVAQRVVEEKSNEI